MYVAVGGQVVAGHVGQGECRLVFRSVVVGQLHTDLVDQVLKR